MRNPQMECEVPQYEAGLSWMYDGSIRLRFIEASHAHVAAVAILDGTTNREMARVPLRDLFRAVEWMHKGAPR